ncbi:MAG: choice-of-anchor tandem repeat NxxGxxAF-containing protein [Pseudomonadota bacterium]
MVCLHACRLLVAAVLLGLAAQPATAAPLRTIALTDDIAPAEDPDLFFAPAPRGAQFASFDSATINTSGQVAFRARLGGSGFSSANNVAIVGPTGIVARTGTPHATAESELDRDEFTALDAPVLSDTGTIAFVGTGRDPVLGEDIRRGIATVGTARGSVFERDGAPGTGGARFLSFGEPPLDAPSISGSGDVAFRAFLTGGDTTLATNRGIFTLPEGGPTALLLRSGSPVPGAGGAVYTDFRDPSINNAGEVAFRGTVSGGGEVVATSSSVIARTGEAAPGTGGAEFSGFSRPILNNAGEVAFRGALTGNGVTGANDQGLFTSSGGFVREGDAAPGTGGAVFAGFGAPSLNDLGEILFGAGLTGPGVTAANDFALFFWDGIRAPSLFLREGGGVGSRWRRSADDQQPADHLRRSEQ